MSDTIRIVFVCSGNICRSPMAAGLAKKHARENGVSAAVLSCGTLGIVGHPAAQPGVEAMAEIGEPIDGHRSQGVQRAILDVADWIVVMAPKHEEALRAFEGFESRIVRMWEWAEHPMAKIEDPVGQDITAFRACRDLLDGCVKRWMDSLTEVS